MADIKLPELLFYGVLIFNGRLPDKASSGIFNQAWRREGERERERERGEGASCRPDAARRLGMVMVKGGEDHEEPVDGERVDRRCLRIPDGD